LPAIRDNLKRFEDAGLEKKLFERSQIVKEEKVLWQFAVQFRRIEQAKSSLAGEVTINKAGFDDATLKELPAGETLAPLAKALLTLEDSLANAVETLTLSLAEAKATQEAVLLVWQKRRDSAQEDYQRILRELQSSSVDAEQFIRLRERIEQLSPLSGVADTLHLESEKFASERRILTDRWQEVCRLQFRRLADAAEAINAKLGFKLRVETSYRLDEDAFLKHLRLCQKNAQLPRPVEGTEFSVSQFIDAIGLGSDAVRKAFAVSPQYAENLCHASTDWKLMRGELDRRTITELRLNVGPDGREDWRGLADLSTGQKATAVLLLLLIDSEAPLIVDQPEDDLDNSFISDSVVKRLRSAKGSRQFIMATHNPNIPVLGDAELIACWPQSSRGGFVVSRESEPGSRSDGLH